MTNRLCRALQQISSLHMISNVWMKIINWNTKSRICNDMLWTKLCNTFTSSL
uniref:Uncharacterized protein n=1 Tax=Arundo donax TaxID=35708 RepID=A0A0A8YDD4_ARUDO